VEFASPLWRPFGPLFSLKTQRAPADALAVKQEFEKALAQDGKPTK
jgi:hypothetical protein